MQVGAFHFPTDYGIDIAELGRALEEHGFESLFVCEHTYSTYGRGVEVMMHTYNMLDLMPKGRDERDVEYKMEWLRHHDRYESAPISKSGSVEELHGALKKQSCH